MIKDKTKQKLIEEIQNLGNVFWSCRKVGINRATYYRWKEEDEAFKKESEEAEAIGRANISDLAESALAQNIKDKNQRAIEYALSHNSSIYKPNHTTHVEIFHKKEIPPVVIQKTLEDLIDEDEELLNRRFDEKVSKIKNKYKEAGGIPPKSDGTEITDDELPDYEKYIEEWYKKKELDSKKKAENKTPD